MTDSAMEEKAAAKAGEEQPIVSSSSSVILSPEQLGEAIGNATSKASDFLEGGLNAASGLTLQVAGTVKGEVAATRNFVQRWGSLVISGLKQADEAVIGTLKEGVHTAVEHQNISVAAGTFALALVLSPTRRLLWRMTLGRFQSAEAAFAAAERRLSSLKETIELQAGETEKLSERLNAARLEYQRGLSKLTAAAAEVKRLAAKVEKTDHSAKALMEDVRVLRSKNGLQLRSDVAVSAAVATKKKTALEKVIQRLEKEGF